jgi:hypothetical protein
MFDVFFTGATRLTQYLQQSGTTEVLSTLPRSITKGWERGSVIGLSALARHRIWIQTAGRDRKSCHREHPQKIPERARVLIEARRCLLETVRLIENIEDEGDFIFGSPYRGLHESLLTQSAVQSPYDGINDSVVS